MADIEDWDGPNDYEDPHNRPMWQRITVNFPLLVVFSAFASASNNFTVLVIFRFLAGMGRSGVLAVGAGRWRFSWGKKATRFCILT